MRILPSRAELSAKPVDVNLGQLGKVVVVLFQADRDASNYTGWVLLPSSESTTYKKSVLPPLVEVEGRFSVDVKSIFAADADGDGAPELCILSQFHPYGTRDAYLSTDCFQWKQGRFGLMVDAGTSSLGLKNAKAVRAHFAKHPIKSTPALPGAASK